MSHTYFQEMIQLALYDELSEKQENELGIHLNSCEHCRQEMDRLQRFHRILGHYKPSPVSETQIMAARRSLRRSLQDLPSPRLFQQVPDWIAHFRIPRLSPVWGGGAFFAMGILVSSIFFMALRVQRPAGDDTKAIGNIRFLDHTTDDGMVAFTYQTMQQHAIRGSLDDPNIQRLLAGALVNEANAGIRLKTVSTLSAAPDRADPEVEAALILILKTDDNPGVRREALAALVRYPFDSQVKDAILSVLLHDANSAMRIAAINSLDSVRVHNMANPEFRDVLEQKLRDPNTYVRMRARTVLQEVNDHD